MTLRYSYFFSLHSLSKIALVLGLAACEVSVDSPKIITYADIDADKDQYCKAGYENHEFCPTKNKTDCDDADDTKWQIAKFWKDEDSDGGTTVQEEICSGLAIPSGYKPLKVEWIAMTRIRM